jgi:phage terminase small subunit
VTIDRVVSEFSKLAFLDTRMAFNEDGDLKSIVFLDDDTAAAIAGVEFDEVFEMNYETGKGKRNIVGRIHKIKLSDKIKALEGLAKFLGIFTEKLKYRQRRQTDRDFRCKGRSPARTCSGRSQRRNRSGGSMS